LTTKQEEYTQDLAEKRTEEKYTTESLDALEVELERIAELLADEALLADSSQADLDEELATLDSVFDKIEKRGKVKDLKKQYDKILKELEEDTNQYTSSTLGALQEELDHVFEAYLKGNDKYEDASQEKLDAELDNIIKLYEALAERGNADKLKARHAELTDQVNLDKYTRDKREEFENIMNEINAFLTDGSAEDASQEEIDEKLDRMNELREELEKFEKGDVAALQSRFTALDNLPANDYNAGSWELFRDKLSDVRMFLESTDKRENATLKDVKEMNETLDAAEALLEKGPVDLTEITEAYDKLTSEFPEDEIKKYITDEKEAEALIAEIDDIHKFFTEDKEKATNTKANEHTERLSAIYDQLSQAKKAAQDLADLEEEHDKVTGDLSKEDKEKYEDELKEMEEYFKGERGEITEEQTKKYLDRLKEIQEELKATEKPNDDEKPGDDNKQPGDGTNSGDDKKPGDGSQSGDDKKLGDGNKSDDGTQSGDSSKSGDGAQSGDVTTNIEKPSTLSETIDKITTDPVETIKDARDKYVLPHTASDNYKYIVTGVLMIVEGLFLYGYFRFFSFLRTRFDLF